MWRGAKRGQEIASCSIDRAAQDLRNLAHFMDQLIELFRQNGLRTIRQRVVRIMMDFNQDSVGPCGYSRARKRQNFVAPARSVRRIHDDRQMAATLHGRNDAEVKRVSRVIGERAYASLA